MSDIFAGDTVYVPTPEHGYVEATVTDVTSNGEKMITLKYNNDLIKKIYGDEDIIYMNSNIAKIVKFNTRKEMVIPTMWGYQNSKKFPDWVYTTFLKYNSCSNKEKAMTKNTNTNTNTNNTITNRFTPYSHQEFIRDYLGHGSPYRGILIYHGLGTGKTCAAVLVCENLKDNREIIVLLPAAIKSNFIKKGLKYCGDPEYRTSSGNRMIEDRYKFVSYNSSNVIAQLDKLQSLDNKVIAIDEIHNLSNSMVNGFRGSGKQGIEIYKRLMNAKNTKIVGLTGTPLVNTPFECALIFNILRGYIDVIYLKLKSFTPDNLTNFLEAAKKSSINVGFIEHDVKNAALILYLNIHTWDAEFDHTMRTFYLDGRKFNIDMDYMKTERYTLFPEDEDEFKSYFIRNDEFINKDTFQRRIVGLTSFYENTTYINSTFPALLPEEIVKVEMSDYQFQFYEMAREVEREKEKKSGFKRKQGDDDKISTLARVFSRSFSNFVFPESIIRPHKMFQFIAGLDEEERRKLEEKEKAKPKQTKEEYEAKLREAIDQVSVEDKPYLKPVPDGLDIYSPKMEHMLKEVTKDTTQLVLVYSAYRSVEGLEIFSRILERNGYRKYSPQSKADAAFDYMRYALYSGKEDTKERDATKQVFTATENKNGKDLRLLLISSAGAEGLDLKNIRLVVIMEPYWHEIRIKQVIGRAVRNMSHIDLPEKDRNVRVVRYMSVFTPKQKTETKEELSTDEYVFMVAKRKQHLNDEFLEAIEETAIDCELNKCLNDSKIKCFKFSGNLNTLAFNPDITKDIIYGQVSTNKKEIVRKLVLSILTFENVLVYKKDESKDWYDGTGKKYKKDVDMSGKVYYLDLKSNEVFDYELYKQLKKTVLVGSINTTNGTFIEL